MNGRGQEGEHVEGCAIREAKVADAAAIGGLVRQLGYPTSTEVMRGRLEALLARREYITFVAEVSGRVVGMVGAYIGYAFEISGPYARLTGLAVEEKWRGQGIGTLLMKHMEGWLAGEGVRLVILTSGSERREAHRFYKKLGYEVTGVRFAKRLGDGGPVSGNR